MNTKKIILLLISLTLLTSCGGKKVDTKETAKSSRSIKKDVNNPTPQEKLLRNTFKAGAKSCLYMTIKEVESLNFYLKTSKNKDEWCSARILNLSGKNIQKIPKEIGNLKGLGLLILGKNNIKEIPKEIVNLDSLQSLALNGNIIESIPEEISKMNFLTSLNLSNNKIKILPKSLFLKFGLNLKSSVPFGGLQYFGNNFKIKVNTQRNGFIFSNEEGAKFIISKNSNTGKTEVKDI